MTRFFFCAIVEQLVRNISLLGLFFYSAYKCDGSMSYLIYGVQIWKVTNTKLASCVIRGKQNFSGFAEKKTCGKKYNMNPFI